VDRSWRRRAAVVAIAAFAVSLVVALAAQARLETATVVKVLDGDSVKLGLDGRVRTIGLLGVNAPELRGGPARTCFGRAARGRLRRLLPSGVKVTVETRRGSRQAPIRRGGRSVNRVMVRAGYARSVRTRGKLGRRLRLDQATAKRSRRGLWATCSASKEPPPIPPHPDALPCVPVRDFCYSPGEAARECASVALGATLTLENLPGQQIRGAESMRFRAYDGKVTTQATNDGPPCDYYGYRTLRVWSEVEDDAGRMRRNGPYLTLTKGNEEVGNQIVRLAFTEPYMCKHGPGERRWHIKSRETARYGAIARVRTDTFSWYLFSGIRVC